MFSDSAYNDFMKRFSDDDLSVSTRPAVQSVNALKQGAVDTSLTTNGKFESDMQGQINKNKSSLGGGKNSGFMDKAVGLASGLTAEMSGPGGYGARYDYNPELQSQYLATEGVKDQIAQAIPMAGAFRAVETATKEISTAIGGEEAGDIAGSIVDPLSTQMELLKNEEATGLEKALGFVPVAGGIAASNARNRWKDKESRKANVKEDTFNKRKREDEYRMAEGLQSMENLKALRKKQLGLL